MRKFTCKFTYGILTTLLLAPALAGCADPHYVGNDGTSYYDANTMAVDTLERGPYTKNGMYYINPDETTNTRDNRGMIVNGYGHDADNDPRQQPPTSTSTTTVVYPNGSSATTVIQSTQ